MLGRWFLDVSARQLCIGLGLLSTINYYCYSRLEILNTSVLIRYYVFVQRWHELFCFVYEAIA